MKLTTKHSNVLSRENVRLYVIIKFHLKSRKRSLVEQTDYIFNFYLLMNTLKSLFRIFAS